MSIFEKFIDSLEIQLGRSYVLDVQKPLHFEGSFDERNMVVQLNKGKLSFEGTENAIKEGSYYFIPQGQHFAATLGRPADAVHVSKEILDDEEQVEEYFQKISGLESVKEKKNVISVASFEVILFDAVPFFPLLKIPPFPMFHDEEFSYFMKYLCLEDQQEKLGKNIILKNYAQDILIQICRYIDLNPKLRKYTEKLKFLNDKRLIDIFHYIQSHLDKDLSNKAIAKLAFVSEEYVGQFFKSLTNLNLQDYIEDQRLERAMHLLKSQPHNVQEVAHKVGFRDPTYFSRRFKLKFGINAFAVKQGKTQLV